MKHHTRAEEAVARLARVRDEQLLGAAVTPPAQALLTALLAEPGPVRAGGSPASAAAAAADGAVLSPGRRRTVPARRRLLIGFAIAVVLTAVAVGGPGLLGYRTGGASTYANSAIEVHREDGALVARIKDPLADGAKFAEAYRAFGKDVRITLAPVPPRLVGQLLQSGGGSGRVSSELVALGSEPVNCGVRPAACTLVIRIPADTTGTVSYIFGRPARPGEPYRDPWAPGGPAARRPGD
jgi:hypothetical protein